MSETLEVLAFGLAHPDVQRPQISHRNIGEGQVMQVAIGAELGRQRADLIAPRLLRTPDRLPMLLVKEIGRASCRERVF